jgi:hypothetical protein
VNVPKTEYIYSQIETSNTIQINFYLERVNTQFLFAGKLVHIYTDFLFFTHEMNKSTENRD